MIHIIYSNKFCYQLPAVNAFAVLPHMYTATNLYQLEDEILYLILSFCRLSFGTGGTEGLFAQKSLEITDDILSTYKNQGLESL